MATTKNWNHRQANQILQNCKQVVIKECFWNAVKNRSMKHSLSKHKTRAVGSESRNRIVSNSQLLRRNTILYATTWSLTENTLLRLHKHRRFSTEFKDNPRRNGDMSSSQKVIKLVLKNKNLCLKAYVCGDRCIPLN